MSIKLILKCTGVLGRGGWGKGGRPERSVRCVMSLAHSPPPPETRESRINGSEKKKGWKLQALKKEEKLRTSLILPRLWTEIKTRQCSGEKFHQHLKK